jgi:mono/diheme cytochrome c family protein/glucose/arabinose dehydrogenase/HEAT repeat protein
MVSRIAIASLLAAAGLGIVAARQESSPLPGNPWPPKRPALPGTAPVLTPAEALDTFSVPPGFQVELVAAEPLVESPIIIDFDADGRLWVLEMPAFLPDASGRDSTEPINRVVVLEDTDDDGRMDRRTIFADGLVMPRALKVLDRGVLVGEPPRLWLMRDENGDLQADSKELVAEGFGNAKANIEHNANALFWAIDNVMYSSEHTWDLRLKNDRFETLPALSRGQWQISQDDAGRVYRNVNDSPLYVDYTPSRYFLRNPNVVRTRGLFELLIDQAQATIFPVRPTRGVNRGYRHPGPLFRPDGSATVIQGAGTPTIYRGDRYPPDMRGDAFITDSPTNLVHRFIVSDDGTGRLSARNGYERGEFLASSDERFRPVNLASAPDGTIYVVDMYRGVVQAGGLWSDYLTGYIKENQLLMPVGYGRIWRVVHGGGASARGPRPALSRAAPQQLVATLDHANGWWRDTAQRLLVERQDRSAVPALADLVASAPDWRTRLHALWTLDGLDAITVEVLTPVLRDRSGEVRAAGVRLSERWLGEPGHSLAAAVIELSTDPSWSVRRQVAASLGALPPAERVPAILRTFGRDGSDPIVVDAAISGLRGVEADVLARLLELRESTPTDEAVALLAAAVTKGGDVAGVERAITAAADDTRPAWQRAALLRGLDMALPARAGGRGRGIGLPGLSVLRSSGPLSPGRGLSLPREPAALARMSDGATDLAVAARAVLAKLDWPGRPAPAAVAPPLTPDELDRFNAGAGVYKDVCAGCHRDDGRGVGTLGADLVDSAFVNGADPTAAVRIVLGGKEGTLGMMPPLGQALSDNQIAAVVTYIRRAWGHSGSAVAPLEVSEVRALSRARTTPWTDPELQSTGRGGRGRGAQ